MPDSSYDAFKLSLGSGTQASSAKLDENSLKNIPLSYCSASIGCKDGHTLSKKIDAISAAGFQAIELSMPDLVSFANEHLQPSKPIDATDYVHLCTAASEIKNLCSSRNLQIMMLQPFANFEGWPEGSSERKDAFERLDGWIRIMEACGTDMLQVGSTDAPESKIGNDRNRFVKDLTELADKLAAKGLRVAYENWCWSTHAPDWADVWDICKKVDRENFGLCLDTFQSAGGEWGDPTTKSGMVENGRTLRRVEQDWKTSCQHLADTVDANKIFVLQISDAYRVEDPFSQEAVDGARPRRRWSDNYRPLPFEGYLPVVDFTKAVLHTGFRGWFSYEIFDSGPDGTGRDYEMEWAARKAIQCQKTLMAACVEQ